MGRAVSEKGTGSACVIIACMGTGFVWRNMRFQRAANRSDRATHRLTGSRSPAYSRPVRLGLSAAACMRALLEELYTVMAYVCESRQLTRNDLCMKQSR